MRGGATGIGQRSVVSEANFGDRPVLECKSTCVAAALELKKTCVNYIKKQKEALGDAI